MNQSIHAVGLGLALGWMLLAGESSGGLALSVFLLLMFVAWGWVVWGMQTVTEGNLRAVLGWAVVLRGIAMWAGPVYEDDWYRYLWDGWRLTEGMPVYGVPPMDSFMDPAVPPGMETVLNGINYPERPTVYGPVTQLAFGLGAWINAGSLTTIKCLWLVLDVLILLGLRKWAQEEIQVPCLSTYSPRVTDFPVNASSWKSSAFITLPVMNLPSESFWLGATNSR